jgi:hypothetical protein
MWGIILPVGIVIIRVCWGSIGNKGKWANRSIINRILKIRKISRISYDIARI